jgi:hypothetical protein
MVGDRAFEIECSNCGELVEVDVAAGRLTVACPLCREPIEIALPEANPGPVDAAAALEKKETLRFRRVHRR